MTVRQIVKPRMNFSRIRHAYSISILFFFEGFV
jgi:hypothetical protein